MDQVLKLPKLFFGLFTGQKNFKKHPIIGSPRLNRFGLHLFRLVFSHGAMRFRMWLLGFNIPKTIREAWYEDGIVVLPDYLNEADLQAIQAEVATIENDQKGRFLLQGDTKTQRILLTPTLLEPYPALSKLFADPAFQRLMRFCNAHNWLPFWNIERVSHGILDNRPDDPQKDYHTDTFHPTMKFWLYLEDVTEANGPFNYLPGSHKPSWQRLKWEYQTSCIARDLPNTLSAHGSFRVPKVVWQTWGSGHMKQIYASKNTLVIANTFGVHGRGQAQEASTRLALWGMFRTNPFSPFPGIRSEWVEHKKYDHYDHFK